MTVAQAYRILKIKPGADIKEIKKRYRKLMLRLHPDVRTSSEERYSYNVQEITIAYSVLKKEMESRGISGSKAQGAASSEKKKRWDGLLNEYAYREREILYYAEDQEGERIGIFTIDRGKYLWKTEEDFPLFLRSIYQCAKEILDEIEALGQRRKTPEIREDILAKLAYLLAQQYIDGTEMLKELAEEIKGKKGNKIFYIPAMLEPAETSVSWTERESFYPSRLYRHRLYLKNESGREIGYLSFPDDRLYYVVIPLFEQRRVQVKAQAAGLGGKGLSKGKSYCRLDFWVKIPEENRQYGLENLNLEIEKLLEKYRNHLGRGRKT